MENSDRQISLFDRPSIDPGPNLKSALTNALKHCRLSRAEVAEKMNELAQRAGITCNGRSGQSSESIINKWCSHSADTHHIPLRLLPIFCAVVSDNHPLIIYAQCFAGIRAISEEDFALLEWAKAEAARRRLTKKAKLLAAQADLDG